jgi:hypothetical protein
MPQGRDRIFVFPPYYSEGAKLDYRTLGVQFWVTDQMINMGLEPISALPLALTNDGSPTTQLAAAPPPGDDEIRETLLAQQSRYGLLMTFAILGETPHLAVARLYEARRGHPLRGLARFAFDGDTHQLAVAAHRLFVETCTRLGATFKPHVWSDLFGTADPVVASNYLTALGCFSACDHGVPLREAHKALQATLSCIATGMPAAIELLPHLVGALRDSGSAEPAMLEAALTAAVPLVDVVPDAWRPMLERYKVPFAPVGPLN